MNTEQLLKELEAVAASMSPGASRAELDASRAFFQAAWNGDEERIKETYAALSPSLQIKASLGLRMLRAKLDVVTKAIGSPAGAIVKSAGKRFAMRLRDAEAG